MKRFELKRGGVVVSFGADQDVRVSCARGELWVTQPGDSADHIIKRNQVFTAASRRAIVIEALQPAELLIEGETQTELTYSGGEESPLPASRVA